MRACQRSIVVWCLPVFVTVVLFATPSNAGRLPKFISNAIAKNVADCSKTKFFKGFVSKKADFNADGIKDYIIDYSRFSCDGMSSYYCGASGGCLTEIFISRGKRKWLKALSLHAQEYWIRSWGQQTKFIVSVHGDKPAISKEIIFSWSGKAFVPNR